MADKTLRELIASAQYKFNTVASQRRAWYSVGEAEREVYYNEADKILSIPITRKCWKCRGTKRVLITCGNQVSYETCPSCNGTGEVTTTYGKLAEEYEG